MLSALAYIFTLIGHIIPISFTEFLRYDPKDAIIVIAGFALGPVSALIISVIVALIELITISTTGPIGFAMNVISSAAFACIASLIYKKLKSINGAVLGLVVSSVTTVCIMLLWNYIMTPIYMGIPREVVEGMLLPIILPFNLIKCGLNSALAMLIYKPCVNAMRRANLLVVNTPKELNASNEKKSTFKPNVVFNSILVIIFMVVLFIVLKE